MKIIIWGCTKNQCQTHLPWRKSLRLAKASGFDFMEISIDETDAKLSRLDMTREERKALVDAMYQAGLPIKTMCLSGHRKYPLGPDESVRARGWKSRKKRFSLPSDLGLRIIQLAGYDVYYEEGGRDTGLGFWRIWKSPRKWRRPRATLALKRWKQNL